MTSRVTLRAGETSTLLDVQRPGRIVGLRLTPASAFAGKRRATVLRAYWDGDDQPAILCPVGDFFGYAWGEPAMQSLLVGTNAAGNYCYFPMPFERAARIELYCAPEFAGETSLDAEVLFVPAGRKKNEGKFYTLWRRENPTTKGTPFTFIQTQGRGHLVGFVHQAQGFESGQTPFFEGDDQTTIDGELVIHGTGSEDFYNGGWYDVPGRWESRRSFVLSGCLDYRKHLGRSGGYRILLGDAYAYRHGILQTIEHAPTGNDILTDYCGTTFLYSEERPTCRFELPPAAERAVTDPTRIVFAAWWNVPIHAFSLRNATLTKKSAGQFGGREVRCLSMQADGDDTFGPPMICFTCDLPTAGTYQVSLDVVKGPAQGKVQLYMDEAASGPAVDLYDPTSLPAKGLAVGTLRLEEGPNQLLFKIVGKHSESAGLGFDLTNIVCQRTD